jgi:IclR family pca regulon transcriptional regulator
MCTASLAVLHGNDIVYIDRARSSWQGHSEVAVRLGRGSRLPADSTAMGRILLAHRSVEEQSEALGGTNSEEKVTIRDKLREEFAAIHRKGFAIADQVRVDGQRCVAAPVRSKSTEVIAAVDVAAPNASFSRPKALEQLMPLVVECAREMSAHLGYAPAG